MISREHWRSSTRRRATYSDCERHRYSLEIQWADIADDPGLERLRRLACIGLNPSTATERANDPTVARLEKWARDAKILDIFEGTQQIQLLIVARRLLGKSSAELK